MHHDTFCYEYFVCPNNQRMHLNGKKGIGGIHPSEPCTPRREILILQGHSADSCRRVSIAGSIVESIAMIRTNLRRCSKHTHMFPGTISSSSSHHMIDRRLPFAQIFNGTCHGWYVIMLSWKPTSTVGIRILHQHTGTVLALHTNTTVLVLYSFEKEVSTYILTLTSMPHTLRHAAHSTQQLNHRATNLPVPCSLLQSHVLSFHCSLSHITTTLHMVPDTKHAICYSHDRRYDCARSFHTCGMFYPKHDP